MESGRRVADVIKSLVNCRDLQLDCDRVFYETLVVPVFVYGSVIMLSKEKERSRIKAVHMDNLR